MKAYIVRYRFPKIAKLKHAYNGLGNINLIKNLTVKRPARSYLASRMR